MASNLTTINCRPIDATSLVFIRIAVGIACALIGIRYLAYGWANTLYAKPTFFFSYDGFAWVKPWPEPWLTMHFVALAALGIFIASGIFYRFAVTAYFVLFTLSELFDKSNYINHYYALSLILFLMIFMPLGQKRFFEIPQEIPAWCRDVLRFQAGLIYFFAGIAKLNADWLIHAQPLTIWFAARSDWPIIGTLLNIPGIAHGMSIAGMLFDLSIPFLLLNKKTRPYAFCAVVVFHVLTRILFNIGMFPAIMTVLATSFLEPSWPRRFFSFVLGSLSSPQKRGPMANDDIEKMSSPRRRGSRRLINATFLIFFVIQIALPLRHFLYPGNVLWTEAGWRFSWRVMLVEKAAYLRYRVVDTITQQTDLVDPRRYITAQQYRLASASPDMILQLAKHVGSDFLTRTGHPVRVYADAFVSLNGRPAARLIDSHVDLLLEADPNHTMTWVTPSPETAEPLL